MASVLDKAKLRAKLRVASHPPTFIKVTDLEIGVKHPIERFSLINTTYGERITADIIVPNNENISRVILPQRFLELTDEIEDFNTALKEGTAVTLEYRGPLATSNKVLIEIVD